ncbi:RICIN domain-containing protein [Streptomyces triticiradicis]|uniref:Ricin-type beta-trefoil lectin domain protein n=1 Tax=Streptomyces triticiradicis TaxID=2651189 RepID=A0A7J5DBU1_9ACTN|nr:RICIN domain-containing protein [Streptomyces triticiradicis]KAB1986293.1 ricin-type beta-trefoil lectin domain protein [Streptomyces triticiradicis]
MAQEDPADESTTAEGGGPAAGASDARLTELLRAGTSTAYTALQELRARHRAPVLAYARLCTTGESGAGQLAAGTFTLAARETARGIDPNVPWRHQLLLLTGRVAASWARDQRAAGLDPGLLLVLSTAGSSGSVPSLLPAFQSLPSRAQGLIWYAVVEREPARRTAVMLGVTPEDVAYGTDQALQSLAQACLRYRLAASDDPRCGDFRRLIEESVRPDNPRSSTDLNTHMAHCVHCSAAYEELTALRDHPRTALAEGLLPWAGTAYVTDDVPGTAAVPPGPPAAPRASALLRPPSRRVVLTSAAALGVALAPVLFLLLSPGGEPSTGAAGAVGTPSGPAAVTVTATVPVTPSASAPSRSASASPSPSATSASPSPSRSSAPPRSPSPRPTPTVVFRPPGGAPTQVVNVASGLCLDVRDGDFEKGDDVVTAPCDSSRTQRWRVADGSLRSAADDDFCLDSRGSVDRGVGIWACSSLDGGHGDNLRFTVDDDGVIRPAVAIETALTPDGDGGLSLVPLTGGTGQRWRAGSA